MLVFLQISVFVSYGEAPSGITGYDTGHKSCCQRRRAGETDRLKWRLCYHKSESSKGKAERLEAALYKVSGLFNTTVLNRCSASPTL